MLWSLIVNKKGISHIYALKFLSFFLSVHTLRYFPIWLLQMILILILIELKILKNTIFAVSSQFKLRFEISPAKKTELNITHFEFLIATKNEYLLPFSCKAECHRFLWLTYQKGNTASKEFLLNFAPVNR